MLQCFEKHYLRKLNIGKPPQKIPFPKFIVIVPAYFIYVCISQRSLHPLPTLAAPDKGKPEQTAVWENIVVIQALTCCKYKRRGRLTNDTTLPPTMTFLLQPVALSHQNSWQILAAAIATLPSACWLGNIAAGRKALHVWTVLRLTEVFFQVAFPNPYLLFDLINFAMKNPIQSLFANEIRSSSLESCKELISIPCNVTADGSNLCSSFNWSRESPAPFMPSPPRWGSCSSNKEKQIIASLKFLDALNVFCWGHAELPNN